MNEKSREEYEFSRTHDKEGNPLDQTTTYEPGYKLAGYRRNPNRPGVFEVLIKKDDGKQESVFGVTEEDLIEMKGANNLILESHEASSFKEVLIGWPG